MAKHRLALSLSLIGGLIGSSLLSPPAQAQDSATSGPLPPGTQLEQRFDTLPAPYASPAVANSAQTIPRPPTAAPRVPPGLTATLFADGLQHARWLAVAPDGAVLLAQSSAGEITLLRDQDHDGQADSRTPLVRGLDRPHGMAFGHRGLYVADRRAVWFTPYPPTEDPPPLTQVTADGARGAMHGHWTRTLALSADQKTLFVGIGSHSNADPDPLPRATIQAFTLSPDGRQAIAQKTTAAGLRNPVGMAFSPHDGSLWTVVNERDGLGDGLVPDYLTQVVDGAFYGWPYSYLGDHPQPDLGPDPEQRPVRRPDLLFHSHSAPLGLVFVPPSGLGPVPAGDALVALHGSWNAAQPRGYSVVQVPFTAQGQPQGGYRVLVSGFWQAAPNRSPDSPATVWGRPVGLAFDHQGGLLIADDRGQTVWRVAPAATQ
jgi:glucose/arabinose dehydrogenase